MNGQLWIYLDGTETEPLQIICVEILRLFSARSLNCLWGHFSCSWSESIYLCKVAAQRPRFSALHGPQRTLQSSYIHAEIKLLKWIEVARTFAKDILNLNKAIKYWGTSVHNAVERLFTANRALVSHSSAESIINGIHNECVGIVPTRTGVRFLLKPFKTTTTWK